MTETSEKSTASGESTGLRKPVLLVVDDDPMIRKIVVHALQSLDPELVLEVADGLQAQKILSERTVDVVITDVLMPNMDGRELMGWAQTHCPGPLWIVLSGLDTFDAAVDALHLGAFDFLAKPPEVRRVRLAVRNAIDQQRLLQERKRLDEELAHRNRQLAEKVTQLEELCRMLEDQAEVIHDDLARAEVIQRALLPQVPPHLGEWCVTSLYRPGSYVGGDLYDIIPLDQHHIGLIVADAAGHGVAAAMLAVLFKHRLRVFEEDGLTPLAPAEVLRMLNRNVLSGVTAPGSFITAAYLLLDCRTGHLQLASAGHPPCVLARSAGDFRLIERSGPALGLEENPRYQESAIELEKGDRLLIYTDGVLEGEDPSLTPNELGRVLQKAPPHTQAQDSDATTRDSAQDDRTAFLRGIYDVATRSVSRDRDDITMVLLERGEGQSRFYHLDQPVSQEVTPTAPAEVMLARGVSDGVGFLSVAGTGTWMRSSIFLDAAVKLLEETGRLTIDLSGCEYLDSTFLGTVHEIVVGNPESVRLQGVRSSLRDLFEELSMTDVLDHVSLTAEAFPSNMEPLKRREEDTQVQAERILKAHEVLASLSDENSEQFREVVESLRAETSETGAA